MKEIKLTFAAIAALFLLAGPGSARAQSNADGTISSVVIPAAQVFSCGVGFSFTRIGVTTHGTVLQFESPAGSEHINVAGQGSGFNVCYQLGSTGVPYSQTYDHSGLEGGWGAAIVTSQPNGPGTYPLEITRTSSNGAIRVTRRITGNSFVGPVNVGNAFYDNVNANGVGCDSPGECGNCTNRTAHVLTRIENISGLPIFNLRFLEFVDADIDNDFADDRFGRTNDSAFAWEDLSNESGQGLLMQSLILPVVPIINDPASWGPSTTDCALPPGVVVASPGGPSDPGLWLRTIYGTLPAGSNTGNNIRTHIRRF